MPRPDWRDMPPVEPVERPERLSVTLLRHHDLCARSAYLYLRHGSIPTIEMDRGTALHIFAERVPPLLVEHGETVREVGDGETEPVEPILEAEAAKDLMNEVLDDHPELGVTARDADHLREMAYHLAGDDRGRRGELKEDGKPYPVGFDWRPDRIVARERTFVLNVEGWQVRGRIDLAHLREDGTLDVRDFKTALHVPRAEEYVGSFQTKSYGAMLLFGHPVNDQGELEPCLGGGVEWVRTAEVFPRFLSLDGRVVERDAIYSRTELREFVDVDLARTVRQVSEALETWRWPAISSDAGCGVCPARGECPLPRHLRSHAGEINTIEQASEALEWADVQADVVSATREEAKLFARAHGVPIPVGNGEEYAFVVTPSRKTDTDGIVAAAERAAMFGEPFDASRFVRQGQSNRFKRRRVVPA